MWDDQDVTVLAVRGIRYRGSKGLALVNCFTKDLMLNAMKSDSKASLNP